MYFFSLSLFCLSATSLLPIFYNYLDPIPLVWVCKIIASMITFLPYVLFPTSLPAKKKKKIIKKVIWGQFPPPSPPFLPLPVSHLLWWQFSKTLMVCRLYCWFTYVYSLLIEKDICDCRNISIMLPLFVCAFHPEISSFFGKSFFCVISISVVFFPLALFYAC